MSGYLRSPQKEDELLDGLTSGTSQQLLPVPTAPAPAPVIAPPAPEAAPAPIPQKPPVQLPGMPPSVQPDELAGYLGKQRSAVNQYGADETMALQNQLNARQNSFGNKATSGLKGFADALMMGVARAGNPGWQGQYEDQERQYAQDQKSALKDARESNLKQTEAGMTLDRMDPSSELSKTKQDSYAPLFEKLGYPSDRLRNMSGADIDSALQLMAAYGGAEKQALIKEYEMEIERAKMAQVAGKVSSEQELARNKAKTDAASEILKRSGNAKFLGVPIPFTSDVSGKEENAAKKVLMDQIQGSTDTASTSYLKTATNPKTGERMGTKDGINWEPIQ